MPRACAARDVTTVFAADLGNPRLADAYARDCNPAAMFTDINADKPDGDVNKPCSASVSTRFIAANYAGDASPAASASPRFTANHP